MKKKEEEDSLLKLSEEKEKRVDNFLKAENNIVSKPIDGFKSSKDFL